jgi:hypothetical protein
MHEEVQLTNYTQISTTVRLELEFEPQFVSPEEAKSKRKQHGKLSSTWREFAPKKWELIIDYQAEHHYEHQGNVGEACLKRGLTLRIEHCDAPQTVRSNDKVQFDLELQSHAVWRLCLSWIARVDGNDLPLPADCTRAGVTEYERRSTSYLSRATSFNIGHDELHDVVGRTVEGARNDLAALRMFDFESNGGVAVLPEFRPTWVFSAVTCWDQHGRLRFWVRNYSWAAWMCSADPRRQK